MTRSSATQLRRGQKRSLIVAALIAPLLVMLALVATPSVAQAGGHASHTISVTPDNGPAGTHVSVSGSSFTSGADVTVGYASGDCSSGVTAISGVSGKVGADGSVNIPFPWPSTQPGDYHVCLTTGGATYPSDNVFHATSADTPSITVTSPVAAGAQVTVTGSNFTMSGAQTVEVLYGAQGSNGCASSLGTANVTNGGFTFTFNAPFVQQTTQYVVTAVDPQGSCASTPTLSAQANLTVNGAPTPTVTISPSGGGTGSNSGSTSGSTTGPGAVGIGWPPSWPPSGAWTVIYCLVGLLLLLLILLMLLLFARNRRKEEPVTIQERDTVTVQGNGQTNGNAQVQREIYSVDPRTGRQVRIAEEVTSFEEVPPDDQPPAPRG